MFTRSNAERHLPDTATDEYRKNLLNMYLPRTVETNFNHAAKQAYIAFTTAIVAAAEQRVDATPMEGFDPTHWMNYWIYGQKTCVALRYCHWAIGMQIMTG